VRLLDALALGGSMTRDEASTADEAVERCELCIVGAGIGGLNALFAASHYLSPRDRVLLIDRREHVGGMWHDTYDHVRLHQPHPMFTAGDIPWQGSRPPEHLAERSEVLAHLQHCYQTLRQRVDLEMRGGYDCRGHEEDTARGVVVVRCEPRKPGRPPLRIEARRFVHAVGFGIAPQPPLPLSSRQVRSVSPESAALFGPETARSSAPVYVVGGGKTGMDTAHALIERFPDKRVRLLIGAGTLFMERDRAFPTGLRRHFGGTVGIDMMRELAECFDGDNEDAVTDLFRARHAVALHPRCRRHMFGVISRAENDAILRGADQITMDYLQDVVDGDAGPLMRLRSGAEHPVEPGATFVNATGHFRESPHPYQPFVSPSGRVLAINARSSLLPLPAYAGLLLVHGACLELLQQLPLYELDGVDLRNRAPEVFLPTVATHMLHNVMQLMPALPAKAQQQFGVDTARWFPLHRRLPAGLRLLRFIKRHPDHLRKSLDRVRERFDLRLGPLPHLA
jgi:hypothetical protein